MKFLGLLPLSLLLSSFCLANPEKKETMDSFLSLMEKTSLTGKPPGTGFLKKMDPFSSNPNLDKKAGSGIRII
jgi:hypothetical protein